MSPEINEGYEEVELVLNADVVDVMEERGILQNEVKMVIHEAEATGIKLYEPDEDHFLAKKRIADTTYFVEYKPASDAAYEVITAYCCKTEIVED